MKKYVVSRLFQEASGYCYNVRPLVYNTKEEALDYLNYVLKCAKEDDLLSSDMDSEIYNDTLTIHYNDDTIDNLEIFEMEI